MCASYTSLRSTPSSPPSFLALMFAISYDVLLACLLSPVCIFHPSIALSAKRYLPTAQSTQLIPCLQLFCGSKMSDKARAFHQSSLSPLQCGPAPLHPQLASLSGSHSQLSTPHSAPLLLPCSSCLLYLDAHPSPIFIAICFISSYSSFKTQLSSSSEKPCLTISVGVPRNPMPICHCTCCMVLGIHTYVSLS